MKTMGFFLCLVVSSCPDLILGCGKRTRSLQKHEGHKESSKIRKQSKRQKNVTDS